MSVSQVSTQIRMIQLPLIPETISNLQIPEHELISMQEEPAENQDADETNRPNLSN